MFDKMSGMGREDMTKHKLETLTFENSYARLPEVFYAKVNPTPFGAAPYLISANRAAMDLLDLDQAEAARAEPHLQAPPVPRQERGARVLEREP